MEPCCASVTVLLPTIFEPLPMLSRSRPLAQQQLRDADALVAALRRGDDEDVRAMLRDGVNPNVPNQKGRLPIMAFDGAMLLPNILQALFDAGAHPDGREPQDRQGRMGRSLLVMALGFGSPGQVQQILDAGADPLRNGAPVAGYTPMPPLSWAVCGIGERHAIAVVGNVETLLAAGANVTSLTLLRAVERHTKDPALASIVVERLLGAGAPMEATLRQPTFTPEQAAWLRGVEVTRQQKMLRAVLQETEEASGSPLRTTRSRARL